MRRFPRAEVPNGSEPLCAMAADVVGVRVRVNETWGECTSPNLHHYPVHGYGSLRAFRNGGVYRHILYMDT
jgi:hypothetical protein